MARDVFMPALGMAQETGVIVAWLKKPGEAVRAGEPLFEVETDKAVMAVDAGFDGVLADLRHGEGAEVPVGEVIARIAEAGEVLGAAGAPKAEAAAATPPSAPATPAATAPAPVPVASVAPPRASPPAPLREPAAPTWPATATNGSARVLASPLARRLAAERGLDLRAVLRAGAAEPLHAADLDRVPLAGRGAGPAASRASARAEAGAFLAFRALLASEGAAPTDAALWAAFAAGSLREHRAGDAPLVVAVERPGQDALRFADPDRGPLAAAAPGADGDAALTLRDLTGTRLADLALARDAGPVLAVSGGEAGYALTLSWPEGSLDEAEAIGLLESMAARIEQPLRHLL